MAFPAPIYCTKFYEKPTVYSLLLGHRQTDGQMGGFYFITNF